ncbi:CsbD family protein [Paraburkholderia fungorum]|jgi:ElaB/YqjD/DUF883 family membrane-anchored ribosome-binding protein|uniref:ElaB/YqjD/DUF883 family membrane-anchored ribosome-binding protein n=1 Tax=Paraburkholderia fungorum TaxID=134537 RepID=A0AAW3URE0_9BURK|nr:CsbD family protein [Paraburkholderia fungorum]MBB4513948.1 ElaB/YqjD/DUF883 family membrane-anchored ribosome-binding protein [Paraburkholderia fungorum]MBB6201189.1 ElaB/YqjD/DUF883 family membrane-anchored ribosome-binding protein [Paraburkholderia fungorum]
METTKGEGTLEDVAGDAQQSTGDLLKETGAQVGATAKELSGKAQQLYADFAEVVRESTLERPFAALAIAAGVGFILGALHAANRPGPRNSRNESRDRE